MTVLNQTFPATQQAFVKSILQIVGASLLMCLCSQIRFILPFTPVPITFQTLAVLMIGATLGSWKGACAILCYFAEILIGLPVLSGGISDPFVFLGPKGGYVLGFCVQAYLMGWFTERRISFFVGGLMASTAQLALGASLLAPFVGWSNVWALGVLPFIPGELLKILVLSKSSLTKSHL